MPPYCQFCGNETTEQDRCCLACAPRLNKIYLDKWESLCPLAFQNTITDRLPDAKAYTRCLRHGCRDRGLMLVGDTGSGKSRVAWLVVRARMLEGWSIEVLDATSAVKYAGMFAKGCDHVATYLNRLTKAKLLFMDDIFKNKVTETFEGLLFAVIDYRMNHDKPILITTNDTGDSLLERLTVDRGEPMVRRLRESCYSINFTKPEVKS